MGIENDPSWFWLAVTSLLHQAQKWGLDGDLKLRSRGQGDPFQGDVDMEMTFKDMNFLPRLRRSIAKYLSAFDLPCDVVIIDELARKECVQTVLRKEYLRDGGLIMLMEAGRGSESVVGRKILRGERLLERGSDLAFVGGRIPGRNGVGNWPNCKRKSPRPTSYYCPLEACKLIRPHTWPPR